MIYIIILYKLETIINKKLKKIHPQVEGESPNEYTPQDVQGVVLREMRGYIICAALIFTSFCFGLTEKRIYLILSIVFAFVGLIFIIKKAVRWNEK